MCVSMLRVCVRRFAKRTAAVKSRIVNVAEGRERENPLNNFWQKQDSGKQNLVKSVSTGS